MTEPKYDHGTRIALLEQTINGVKGELSQINTNIGRLVWTLIVAILMAFLQFALRGGLSGV
jgi:hypothetical protein